ncbi:MAG TPA: hypothetical protein HA224_01770 [Nanoarchaeota archaeon]|nr:hypothetical protein [Nanoarchaeota archaeon]
MELRLDLPLQPAIVKTPIEGVFKYGDSSLVTISQQFGEEPEINIVTGKQHTHCTSKCSGHTDIPTYMLERRMTEQRLATVTSAMQTEWILEEINLENFLHTGMRAEVFTNNIPVNAVYHLTLYESGVDRPPVLVIGTDKLPFIVPAINYIYRAVNDMPTPGYRKRPTKIRIEAPFKQMLLKAYQNSPINCRLNPEVLHLASDPESLTASGAVCTIPQMTEAEIDERLKELARK